MKNICYADDFRKKMGSSAKFIWLVALQNTLPVCFRLLMMCIGFSLVMKIKIELRSSKSEGKYISWSRSQ